MSFDTNQRLNGLFPLGYMGANAVQPPNFVTRAAAPNSGDSKNFQLGTIWLDTTGYPNTLPGAESVYMLVALVGNTATWVSFAGTSALETLTANSGGAVSGDANDNINILGDTTTINIVGNPGTNTLTVSTTGSIAASFPTDSGTATPALGALTIHGGENMNTVGSGSTVTVNLDEVIRWPNTDAGGTTGMIYLGATCAANECTGGTRFMHNFGTNNTFLGSGSGNLTLSGSLSVGVGRATLAALTSGAGNTAVGDSAGTALQNGSFNTLVGDSAGSLISSGSSNTFIGDISGSVLSTGGSNTAIGAGSLINTTGSHNVCIGKNSTSGTSSETSNIVIGSGADSGAGNSNKLLIGSGAGTGTGQLTKAFIHGIRGITPANGDVLPVVIDSAGQLGTAGVSAVPSFLAYKSANTTNFTGQGPIPSRITFDTEAYDIGSNYNNATGVFTAPTAGMYMFATCVSAGNLSAAMTSGLIYFIVSGTGPSTGFWGEFRNNAYVTQDALSGVWRANGTGIYSLAANDTVAVDILIEGGAGDTATLLGSAATIFITWFSGIKLA